MSRLDRSAFSKQPAPAFQACAGRYLNLSALESFSVLCSLYRTKTPKTRPNFWGDIILFSSWISTLFYSTWEKSFTFKLANAVTKSEPRYVTLKYFDLKTFGENSTKDVLVKFGCYRQSWSYPGNYSKRCERWYFWRGKWFDLQDVQNVCWHFWHFKLSSSIFVKLTSWRFSVKLVWFLHYITQCGKVL